MKSLMRLWGTLTALAVVFPFLAYGQSATYYDRSYTRMSYVQGDVYVQRAQDLGYEKGEINLVVVQGDKIGSRTGRLEIQLGRGNYLRLDNDTQVDLVNLPGRDGDPTKLHVLAGSVFLRVQALDREKNFEIHTPDASLYLLAAGSYRVDVRENRETEFSVLSGSAEAAGEEGSVSLGDGQRIGAANGRFTSEAVSLPGRGDDFGGWSEARDASYAPPAGRTYLPREYSDYENELNENGRWVNEEEYGDVWVPRGVSSDWRPYSSGRWVWYPIIGWTWVSSDSWGWCTYHYGRWGWGSGLGWYWIPRDHWGWGPAWVNWWDDDYYIGWCPLSYWGYPAVIYNNRFFGRYRFGEYYSLGHFARTMTMVDRNRLWDRNINRAALSGDRLLGRNGRISLSAHQPNIRPGLNRADGLSSQAASALGRGNLRSIGGGYSGNGRRLSTEELRTSLGRGRSGGLSSLGSQTIRDGGLGGNRSLNNRSLSTNGSASTNARRIREYSGGRSSSLSGAIPRSTTGRSGNGASSTMRSFPSRLSGSSSYSRSSSGMREYGSAGSPGRSGGSSGS
ncbi:MAG: FecR family protein, partial [Candidatus Aminicenantales bacterium]